MRPAPGGHLLHVVGQVTDEVFSFLGPATRALARSGHLQHVIVVDAPEHRHNVRRLDDHASVVRVAQTPNPLRHWRDVVRACEREFFSNGPSAVHLHGLVPLLLVSVGLRSSGIRAPVVYSPHGSHPPGTLPLAAKLAMLAAKAAARPARSSAIVTVRSEGDALDNWSGTDVVESPVADVFFRTPRHETGRPLIVGGGRTRSERGIDLFTQLAVLLSDEELGLGFHWLGAVPAGARQRLRAAGVSVFPGLGDDDCAAQLSRGWMYVAPGSNRGFPLVLVQAMAAGLACVALDCDQYRDIVQDGRTGFLCATETEMVRRIAMLVDDAGLRTAMGAAARVSAHDRFSEANFDDKLLTAYSTRW